MSPKIPAPARDILSRLEAAGHRAYLVGGCVRDNFLGRHPHDWDVATSATPDMVTSLFPEAVPTGIAFGTVTIPAGGVGYEITTFRTDGDYADGRRPQKVNFVGQVEDDLARRDFTVNAMAMSLAGTVIDPFGGLADLRAGVIRAVGEPAARFGEDRLRVLRAVRFAGTFGFRVESATAEAAIFHAALTGVSRERVVQEMVKLLNTPGTGWIAAAVAFTALPLFAAFLGALTK